MYTVHMCKKTTLCRLPCEDYLVKTTSCIIKYCFIVLWVSLVLFTFSSFNTVTMATFISYCDRSQYIKYLNSIIFMVIQKSNMLVYIIIIVMLCIHL
jgi:hypothetical protein